MITRMDAFRRMQSLRIAVSAMATRATATTKTTKTT
jgi:hypothetical protein